MQGVVAVLNTDKGPSNSLAGFWHTRFFVVASGLTRTQKNASINRKTPIIREKKFKMGFAGFFFSC